MLYNSCMGIYKFGNNTYPRRIRRRSNLGHIFRKKKYVLWAGKYGTCKGGFTTPKRTLSFSSIRTNVLNALGEIIAVYCGIILYLFKPCSRVLLQKLTGSQLVKKFPAFYGSRRFITAFTSARHLSISWARMSAVLNTWHKCCWLPLTLTLTFPGLAGEDGGSGGRHLDRRAGCDLHARVSPVRVHLWQWPLCASQPLLWCCEWLWRLFRRAPLVYT
jgi:hypothetical protein